MLGIWAKTLKLVSTKESPDPNAKEDPAVAPHGGCKPSAPKPAAPLTPANGDGSSLNWVCWVKEMPRVTKPPNSYGGRARVEGRTEWGGSGGSEGELNKGETEGDVVEEGNGCSNEGTGAPKESAPVWVEGRE